MRAPLTNRIRLYRRRGGLTQQQLAEVLGVSRQAISQWELQQTQPSAGTAVRLLKALGVTVDELFDLGEESEQA